MIINVKVKTNSSQQKIEDFGNHHYLIYLRSAPENNEANLELLKLLSKYFGIPATHIKFKAGIHNNEKILELD